MEDINAKLRSEWNEEKNDISFENAISSGHKKVWWKCSVGHEWIALVSNRKKGSGCPICAGQQPWIGHTDLETINPSVCVEWNYEKNGNLHPRQFLPNSSRKVWWKCSEGHEWESKIVYRNRGAGCPFCSGTIPWVGHTDFATLFPILAREWDFNKNDISPSNILPGSNKKVYWKCMKGHSWIATPNARKQGHGCPYCSGLLPISGVNDLLTIYPDIANEWDYEKNDGQSPKDFLPSSNKNMWWKCKNNHSWKARIGHRVAGSGCPICGNRIVLAGTNDLLSQYPELCTEWNYDRNDGLKPSEVVYSTPIKVWWKCSEGHEWQASIDQRVRVKTGCPTCSGRLAWEGKTDLKTLFPEVAKEWNYEKNNNMFPENVTSDSKKQVWWICPQGHEWKESVSAKRKRKDCPICCGRIVLVGFNDLNTTRPDLVNEWDFDKNLEITPKDVTDHSDLKVWWVCEKKHSWQAKIRNRALGAGCLICGHQTVVEGINDLNTINNELASEWHPTKNSPLRPTEVFPNSNIKVWWKCKLCGHEWKAAVHSRNRGVGCPRCAFRTHTSFPEQLVYYYIKQVYADAINGYKNIEEQEMELDIYIPSQKMAIEYDGKAWHNSKASSDRERRKYLQCKKNGICLVRIKEELSSEINVADYIVQGPSEKYEDYEFVEMIHRLSELLPKLSLLNVDIEHDRMNIKSQYLVRLQSGSLSSLYPQLSKEWNYLKNGMLKPDYVLANSNDKVWWKCSEGHEWKASIDNRVKGNGCPYCSGRIAITGKNDLATLNPKITAEWDYEKNGNLRPENVKPNSNLKVWWICPEQHEYQSIIASRNSGTGCPICAGRQLLIGYNDLVSCNPELAAEWNYERNNGESPKLYFARSNKKVWWRCSEGHEWLASIVNRNNGTGCPYCAGNKVLAGYNDFQTHYPQEASEWDYEKNGQLLPSMFTCHSNRKVWWKCKNGHRWQAAITKRANGNGNCTECRKKKVK